MKGIRDDASGSPVVGRTYLELHRGTLTSIAGIKKGNRTAEIALREAEFLSVLSRLHGGGYPSERLLDAWKLLLLNQFHDILPGSSIAQVNDEAIEDFARVRAMANDAVDSALRGLAGPEGQDALVVANSLSWPRTGEIALRGVPEGLAPLLDGAVHQTVEDVSGDSLLSSAT